LDACYAVQLGDSVLVRGNVTEGKRHFHDFALAGAPGELYPITVVLDVDGNDDGSGWSVSRMNLTGGSDTLVARSGVLPLRQRVWGTVLVERGGFYRVEIRSGEETGFIDHSIVAGSNSANDAATITSPSDLYSSYSTFIRYIVLADSTGLPTVAETTSDKGLQLELELDSAPGDTAWFLVSFEYYQSLVTGETVSLDEDRIVYAFGPIVSYGSELAFTTIQETIPLTMEDKRFLDLVFIITDRIGDGLEPPGGFWVQGGGGSSSKLVSFSGFSHTERLLINATMLEPTPAPTSRGSQPPSDEPTTTSSTSFQRRVLFWSLGVTLGTSVHLLLW